MRGGDAGAMRSIRLVARREFTERVSSRAYQLSTLITILLVGGLLIIPSLFDNSTHYTVGVVGDPPEGLAAGIEAGSSDPETTVTIQHVTDADALRTAVEEGEVDIGMIDGITVVIGPETYAELNGLVMAAAGSQALLETAARLDIDQQTLTDLLSSGPNVEEIEPDDDEFARSVLAFIGTLVLFVSIVTYGQWVLQGVVEEKTSRVVEVVLGAVMPRHLLAGKVLGIGALGLVQVLVIAVTGFVAARMVDGIDIPQITIATVATVVCWFVLGFAFYASGYAVAGSLVSNSEDAQNASFPLTMVLMIGYFVASSAFGGDNPVLRVLSIIPPFSPLVMPLRQVSGNAAGWEVALSVALMTAATAAMLRIGGRVYAGGLLRSGGRSKAREAFRGAEI